MKFECFFCVINVCGCLSNQDFLIVFFPPGEGQRGLGFTEKFACIFVVNNP